MKLAILALLTLRLFAGPLDGLKPMVLDTTHVKAPVASDCVSSPCVSTVNLPIDTAGAKDTRPNTWGTAAAVQVPIQFDDVPAGYSVSILRVYGDFIAWAHGKVPEGTHSGLLWGLFNSQTGASQNVEYGSYGCPIYFQGAVGSSELTRPFDQVITAGGILPSNNILISQSAIFLNDTGQSIHLEPTFAIVYQFFKPQ